jgi:hypothetical protein
VSDRGTGAGMLATFLLLALLIPAGILAAEAEAIPRWLGFAPIPITATVLGWFVWLIRQ